jgi:hypothetical protein
VGSLFKKPETPVIKPPTPIADEAAIAKARKSKIVERQRRSGRTSTILSDKESLGG